MKKSILVLGLAAVATASLSGAAMAADPMYFLNHNDLPASGAISMWDGASAMTSFQGDGVPAAGPDVAIIGGQKWAQNYYVPNVGEPWTGAAGSAWGKWTGFKVASPTTSIPVNGATFMVAVQRSAAAENQPWTSVVDVMYDKLVLGVRNDTGQIVVRRNTAMDTSTSTLAVGQSAILSLVCQADGSYQVFADGVSVLTGGANGTMTEWDPNRTCHYDEPNWVAAGVNNQDWGAWWGVVTAQTGVAANDWTAWWALPADVRAPLWGYDATVQDFKKFINIGRNNPDGWTAFNGYIGDVKIWGSALDQQELLAQSSAMSSAMGIGNPVPEPASILAMLTGLAGLGGFVIRRKSA